MRKATLYNWLSTVVVSVGLGMVLGVYLRGDTNSVAPYWIAGILIFFGAVIFGMAIATASSERQSSKNLSEHKENEPKEK